MKTKWANLIIKKWKRGKTRWCKAWATREELQSGILGTLIKGEYDVKHEEYRMITIEIPDSFPQIKFVWRRGQNVGVFARNIDTPTSSHLDDNGRFIYIARGVLK